LTKKSRFVGNRIDEIAAINIFPLAFAKGDVGPLTLLSGFSADRWPRVATARRPTRGFLCLNISF
jgi:hypothetical protein